MEGQIAVERAITNIALEDGDMGKGAAENHGQLALSQKQGKEINPEKDECTHRGKVKATDDPIPNNQDKLEEEGIQLSASSPGMRVFLVANGWLWKDKDLTGDWQGQHLLDF